MTHEAAQNAETVCEHCMGKGRVPVEGWSFEHGSEPCPFCDPRHAHLDHVFNSPECWDKCGDPADWTEVELLPEGEYVMMTDEFESALGTAVKKVIYFDPAAERYKAMVTLIATPTFASEADAEAWLSEHFDGGDRGDQ